MQPLCSTFSTALQPLSCLGRGHRRVHTADLSCGAMSFKSSALPQQLMSPPPGHFKAACKGHMRRQPTFPDSPAALLKFFASGAAAMPETPQEPCAHTYVLSAAKRSCIDASIRRRGAASLAQRCSSWSALRHCHGMAWA